MRSKKNKFSYLFPSPKVGLKLLIGVIIFITFFSIFINLFNDYLVKYIFSRISIGSWFFDVFYLIVFLGLCFGICSRLKNEGFISDYFYFEETKGERIVRLEPKYYYGLAFYLVILFCYSFFRFGFGIYGVYFEFYPVFNSPFYIADLFYLTGLFYYLILTRNVSKLYEKFNDESNSLKEAACLLEDAPIDSEEEDELEGLFGSTSNKIIEIIKKNDFKKAFTIGLSGEWGDGKSSVFNLCKRKLQKNYREEIVVVDFSPWFGFDKEVLIKDFFTSIAEKIDSGISLEFNRYADQVIHAEYGSDLIRFAKSLFIKEKSLERRFDDINNKIRVLNKKIVVFVDDVDRLDKEEIFELLKLIRKTANFHNFFFVIAYDREYVNNSITEYNASATSRYLDKIINVEINLPYFDRRDLFSYLFKVLKSKKEVFKEFMLADLEKNILKSSNKHDFIYWISNFRDVKKILNSIFSTYNFSENDLNLYDVLSLEILRLKHPYIYRLIYTHKDQLLGIDSSGDYYYFKSRSGFPIRSNNLNKKVTEKTILEEYLEIYYKQHEIHENEQKQIVKLIEKLFAINDINMWSITKGMAKIEKYNFVCYVSNFEKYFAHVARKNVLTRLEIKQLKNEDDIEKFNKLIEELYLYKERDFIFELKKEAGGKGGYINHQHIKNYFHAYMYLMTKLIDNDSNNLDTSYTGDLIFSSLSNTLNNLKIDGITDKNRLKEIVKELFDTLDSEYLYCGTLVLEELKINLEDKPPLDSDLFPLTTEQINRLQEDYLIRYLENENKFDPRFWALYLYAERNNKLSDSKLSTIHKKIVEKNEDVDVFASFLKSILKNGKLIPRTYDDFKKLIEVFYRPFVEFEKLLDKLDDGSNSIIKKEFKAFHEDLLEKELAERLNLNK